jgi:hypothetical protein
MEDMNEVCRKMKMGTLSFDEKVAIYGHKNSYIVGMGVL